MNPPLKIALAGLGTVGGGVAKLLSMRGAELAARAGRGFEIVACSSRDERKARDLGLAGWSGDAVSLARGPADIVIELIGGEDGAALALIEAALGARKHVVTANKALLAKHGKKLAVLAEKNGTALKFEAAVAGGIPIVKSLRESLVAYEVSAVKGILNGTCNYILTEMESTGRSFAEVLKDAQELGYAEADPALDVGGGDTAHKLALLASLAFGTAPDLEHMSVEGIESVTPEDIGFAREFGFRIKLLGVARRVGGGIEQRVHLAMVRSRSALAHVDGAANAVVVDAGAAGQFLFSGRGAGEAPTASAVAADLVEIAQGSTGTVFGMSAALLRALQPAAKGPLSACYLRFEVLDTPGVLAEIAGHLAKFQVSIESMIQRGRSPGEPVSIVMITHETAQSEIEGALKAIATSDKVRARPCMIPMESA